MTLVVAAAGEQPVAGGAASSLPAASRTSRGFIMLSRKKTMAGVVRESSMLDRVLSVTDLTALGVGSTIGVGVYVLPGALSKYVAGPAVVLSFFFAAVASVFAGKTACPRFLYEHLPDPPGRNVSGKKISPGKAICICLRNTSLLEKTIAL